MLETTPHAHRPSWNTPHGARTRLVSIALAVALVIGTPLVAPVQADPADDPTNAVENATNLAEIDAAVAQLERDQNDAIAELLSAGEEYTIALEEYRKASTFADEASEKAEMAGERARESRRFVARMARESSRGSLALDTLGAFFVADGLESLVTETVALDAVNEKTDQKFQQFQADKLVADILAREAREAIEQARLKRDLSTQALQRAELLEAQAETRMREAETKRTELIAQAAAARQASIEEEEQRQQELAMQRVEADRQATLDRIERQEEAAANNNVEVEEAPRSSATPTRDPEPEEAPAESEEPSQPPSAEPSSEPSAEPTREPSPTREPTASPSQDPEPTQAPAPEPTRTSTPTPTPTKTQEPKPDPAPVSDPHGLGKGVSVGSAAKGRAAIVEARKHLGKEYLLGAAGPNKFDCSGLTSVAWNAAGVSITRTSRSQYKRVKKIQLSEMRPGDLIFWGTGAGSNNADSIYHVAMFIGGGQMIEAVRPGKPLQISSIRYDGHLMPYAGRP